MNETSGIVFLDTKYRVGIDMKFKVDAYVVILDEKHILTGEDILQMLGRGSRAKTGVYEGAIFCKGDPKNKVGYNTFITANSEPELKECAQILRALRFTYEDGGFNKLQTAIIDEIQNGTAMMSMVDFKK